MLIKGKARPTCSDTLTSNKGSVTHTKTLDLLNLKTRFPHDSFLLLYQKSTIDKRKQEWNEPEDILGE